MKPLASSRYVGISKSRSLFPKPLPRITKSSRSGGDECRRLQVLDATLNAHGAQSRGNRRRQGVKSEKKRKKKRREDGEELSDLNRLDDATVADVRIGWLSNRFELFAL